MYLSQKEIKVLAKVTKMAIKGAKHQKDMDNIRAIIRLLNQNKKKIGKQRKMIDKMF